MATLSVITITLNEERRLPRALRSVAWADERIVIDSFSTDGTAASATMLGATVYQYEFPGSSRQMERGVAHAIGDWVLFLDADEEVSPELADEIRRILREGTPHTGFDIPFRNRAFGKWIEHGGWSPDYHLRLIRRNAITVQHAEVHGGFGTTGSRGRLRGVVNHYTYDHLFAYVGKMNDYTSLEVGNRLSSRPNARVRWYNLILSPISHFLTMFVSRKGYKDGMHGFLLAALDAVYSFLLYAKLWEYRKAQQEGRPGPPITNRELNRVKRNG